MVQSSINFVFVLYLGRIKWQQVFYFLPCFLLYYSGGFPPAQEGEEAAEVLGVGGVVADVLLGGGAVLGDAGGEVEGEVEVGTDIGGGTTLALGVDGIQLAGDLSGEILGGEGIVAQMGADEHNGQETAVEDVAGDGVVAEMVDVVERGGIGLAALGSLLVVDAATENVEEGAQELGDELAVLGTLTARVDGVVMEVLVVDIVHTERHGGSEQLDFDGETGALGGVLATDDAGCASTEGCGGEYHLFA